MLDHELKVTCVKTGKELIVSKRHYKDNTALYELVEGDPLSETSDKGSWKPPTPPIAAMIKPEKNKAEVKPVAKIKEPVVAKVEPPKL